MRTARFVLLPLLVGLVLALPAGAQQFEEVPKAQPSGQQPQSPPAAGIRIGVINIQAAMVSTQEGKKAAEDLQARFNPRKDELERLQREIRDLENQLRTQERTISDQARLKIVRDVEQKRKQAQRLEEDLRDEMEDARADVVNHIGEKLQRILDQYAKENNLALILNAFQGGPVIYATGAVDITQDVIEMYDRTYPVQTTTGANQPSSNRPR